VKAYGSGEIGQIAHDFGQHQGIAAMDGVRAAPAPGNPGKGTDGHPNSGVPVKSDGSSSVPDDMETCPLCDGAGKIRGGNLTCPKCGGKGAVPIDALTGNAYGISMLPLEELR